MKKVFVMTMLLMFVATFVYGAIVNTEGETKVGQAIKQIYSQVDNCQNSVGVIYAKAKLYVTEHTEQFISDDKTKLNGLQTEISNWNAKGESLKTYIKTNFSGLNE